ncbi:Eco57I restriction-modification methylase domain-containing protein [Lacticaseibacillus paracasei]|uniref:Eco57I restriction-modification methylase domain-containing protein n=1 Tax=Lacticaseibacillus paracasei TaxID=1597 RepID=UPI001C026A2A|nr:Eco57I restriction-modification methylase domain-containing protein [Lacticaseibacillus paracasei]MBT9261817.1 Eco57I restriction-modification methylase domain-containing protein [Lacticaseibacillus paracasei]
MSSNFDYLKENMDSLPYFHTANFLEQQYAMGDYASELASARKIAENVVKYVLDQNYLSNDGTFAENLKVVKFHHLMDQNLISLLYGLKQPGNVAAHTLEQYTQKDGLIVLHQVVELLYWFSTTFCDYAGDLMSFVEPTLYSTSERHVIYSMAGDNSDGQWPRYEGLEKVGETTASEAEEDWRPNSKYLRLEASRRIGQYMGTSGVPYRLDWVELAWRKDTKSWFDDHDVHRVLLRSGYKRDPLFAKSGAKEWFKVDADHVKKAIAAVKAGRMSIDGPVVDNSDIKLRPEQKDAVEKTTKTFKTKTRMLWNAKMRFGKTLSALELIKKENYSRVLIMTHRPVVAQGWFDDFLKIGMPKSGYKYGSRRSNDLSLEALQREASKYVYFASLQDLRESRSFGGRLEKNQLVKKNQWDLVIIDEAHEGTQTELAKQVIEGVVTPEHTRVLELSGTPFNLLDQYEEDEVYTWDYVMEQQAKYSWDSKHPNGESNPYIGLPSVSMYTFEMKKSFGSDNFLDDNKSFNFHEFFKVNQDGRFVYEEKVLQFLDNISSRNSISNYPFSTPEFRNKLRHTLWLMPSVKSARAMKTILDHHLVFKHYKVVNIVDKDTSDNIVTASDSDIDRVKTAITAHPARSKSITLTVRKMTTGVTIKPWTGVLFLSNTSSATQYLQAAFRAQTPYEDEEFGRKTNCYIFDFAPDRALNVMAASRQMSAGLGKLQTFQQRKKLGELLNFLPIIGEVGNGMQVYKVDTLITQLKKVYAEKAVRTGFDDDSIYNDELLRMTSEDMKMFNDIKAIVGHTEAERKPAKIDVNHQGLSDEQYERAVRAEKKPKRERTPDEQADFERKKALRKQRNSMISVLRGISIRIPMMIYGMNIDIDKDVDIQGFITMVDPQSWEEFMPEGITKDRFRKVAKYYDPEVFIEAGRIIRRRVKLLDQKDPLDRTIEIAKLFSTFKNPDKETVLTPWRIVNMQLGKTIGGLSFFDDLYQNLTKNGKQIISWRHTGLTDQVFNNDSHILEINSKTGLYPLYVASSLYYKEFQRLNDEKAGKFSAEDQESLWEAILDENIFAIAKTPMAKTIAQRTLSGYKEYKTNIVFIPKIVETARNDIDSGIHKIKEAFGFMKFDVVIGNPPYQESTQGSRTSDRPIYHLFMQMAFKLAPKVTMITPARFLFDAGDTPSAFNQTMLNDPHFRVVFYKWDSSAIFPRTQIKGGIAITLRDKDQNFGAINLFTVFDELKPIYHKIKPVLNSTGGLTQIISTANKLKLETLYAEFPDARAIVSSGGKERRLQSNIFKKLSVFHRHKTNDQQYNIFGVIKNKRVNRFIERKYIEDNDVIHHYKVLLPKSSGNGQFGEKLADSIICGPGDGFTYTFIAFGSFNTKTEALNAQKYIKTKFARSLLGVLKVTQDNTPDKWADVPVQDFSTKSDIDWRMSITKIDKQLYEKYKLTSDDINFIEDHVQEMN